MLEFDASIDLELEALPPAERDVAVRRVRERVSALPGARWISVELHRWAELRVFPAGSCLERAEEAWRVLRARVEEAAARVVAVQMWQARVAARRPVPADVVERARAASTDLESAAY